MSLEPFDAPFAGDAFSGIFTHLHKLLGKNPADTGIVKVIPSDTVCSNFTNVILPGWKQHWFSFHPNPFITFDFLDHTVSLTGYSLKTYSGDAGCGHMKSWVLEGSNDGTAFTTIDEQTDTDSLNASCAHATFTLEAPPYRFIRLRLIGKTHAGSDFLVLRNIELFGSYK